MDHYVTIEVQQPDKLLVRKFLGFRYGVKKVPQPPRVQGILFDLYAWFLLWEHFGWDFDLLGKRTVDELASGMLYTGSISWCKFHGLPINFTKDDVGRWMDDLSNKKMKEIGKVLTESMKVLEPLKAAGESKKK